MRNFTLAMSEQSMRNISPKFVRNEISVRKLNFRNFNVHIFLQLMHSVART